MAKPVEKARWVFSQSKNGKTSRIPVCARHAKQYRLLEKNYVVDQDGEWRGTLLCEFCRKRAARGYGLDIVELFKNRRKIASRR